MSCLPLASVAGVFWAWFWFWEEVVEPLWEALEQAVRTPPREAIAKRCCEAQSATKLNAKKLVLIEISCINFPDLM
jgi:hypothetical protein